MAKVVMVQGTMSGVGKSLLVAGLCRIMKRDGYRVAPFKSQNMALNSFVTKEGLEMGRAQVMQAEAAGMDPMVCMNPILLKPTDHTGSQVIVNGRAIGNMRAREYFSYKKTLLPEIGKAFRKLEEIADIIVIEGAGSPAEINLKENDIVNMGMARLVDAPVLLVGDIDRGGVFAQLLGTLLLLSEEEKKRIRGLVINKFRGDRSLLDPGIEILEKKGGIPVTGVIPYMEIMLEDEDSLTERFAKREEGVVDLAVIHYPRISNFTDFNIFEQIFGVSVRYVNSVAKLGRPDMIFLPGSKNTMEDLAWMRSNGLESAVKELAQDVPVCGICGGYQMLGREILDPEGVESAGAIRGMGLLPVRTILQGEKVCRQVSGIVNQVEGVFSGLSGLCYEGYEIHMGRTENIAGAVCGSVEQLQEEQLLEPGVFVSGEATNVYGTYVHGVFDQGGAALSLVEALARRKGILSGTAMYEESVRGDWNCACMDYRAFKENQYDKLADILSAHLNMEEIYGILREAHLQ